MSEGEELLLLHEEKCRNILMKRILLHLPLRNWASHTKTMGFKTQLSEDRSLMHV